MDEHLHALPLVAILRGLAPADAPAIGDTLVGAGFRVLEVPLNSPDPLRSIEALAVRHGGRALIGAGTVTRSPEVDAVAAAGGRLIVMPHADVDIVRHAKSRGLWCVPGIATPTEAFAAIAAGADALKLFPAEMLQPPVVKALRAVLPREIRLLPVGGITPARLAAYVAAGAGGFGLGSALYSPGMTPAQVGERAAAFAAAWRAAVGTAAC